MKKLLSLAIILTICLVFGQTLYAKSNTFTVHTSKSQAKMLLVDGNNSSSAVTLTGTVTLSDLEGLHYELGSISSSYVLKGKFNFKKYLNKKVKVTGYTQDGISIWMKSVLIVSKIEVIGVIPMPGPVDRVKPGDPPIGIYPPIIDDPVIPMPGPVDRVTPIEPPIGIQLSR